MEKARNNILFTTETNRDLFNTTHKIQETHTSELVIALCGPIGSPLHKVGETIRHCLVDDFGYKKCEVIRLSKLIEEYSAGDIDDSSPFKKTRSLIDEGNELRNKFGSSILAELAISKISRNREHELEQACSLNPKPVRVCHIIDSIKNQEELDILRAVYREMLYFVGVFSPVSAREAALKEKGMNASEIHLLIDQDSGEEIDHGQTVRDTFPNADFFLRTDAATQTQLGRKVERFLGLILGTSIITPTAGETAMYTAASAATNSACLSRQVGAALTSNAGEILSVGWNDVPKSGGGLYVTDPVRDPNSESDHRCWNAKGECTNDKEKAEIANLVISELSKAGVIVAGKESEVMSVLRNNGRLKGLIEFSRAVHAEMHAIISAGNKAGGQIVGGKLYVTTYPCHSCARHIISAGISEVYYIEPYRKSLAVRLHGDDITEDESDEKKVRILPFDGVAPNRYLDLFKMKPGSRKEKNNGKLIQVKRSEAEAKISKTLEALSTLEGLVVSNLVEQKLIEAEKN